MIVFHPEALAEIERAVDWYNGQRAGLGAELADEIAGVLVAIAEAPASFARDPHVADARRALLARFPYAVVFSIEGDDLLVAALAHGKRRPAYYVRRVR
jgi:plasmid stabilization system protein ParE